MGGYAWHKTPQGERAVSVSPAANRQHRPAAAPPPTAPSTRIQVLRAAIALAMTMFVLGNLLTFADVYEVTLMASMTRWWGGYPSEADLSHVGHLVMDTGIGRNISYTGHTEMVRPTCLVLFCSLPFVASVVLIEYLRNIHTARRLTAAAVWRGAMALRRKPRWPLGFGVSTLSLGEWLFGVGYVVGGNVICFLVEWTRRVETAKAANALTTTKYWNIIGISCAYLCIYNMAFLLLPVTHHSAWLEFFNLSYANAVKFHRWVGFMTVLTAVCHMLGYWVKWVRDGTWMANQLPCLHCDFTADETGGGYFRWFNTFGFLSVLSLLLIIVTSLPIMRRRMYETFYFSHWTLFCAAVFFAILHWAQILWWLLPAGCIWFSSRAVSKWNGFHPVVVHDFTVERAIGSSGDGDDPEEQVSVLGEQAADEVVRIVLTRAAPGMSPMARSYDYEVGQFVYLNVPFLSARQWHPLTIASSPKTSATKLTLLVKPLGDWTTQLVQYEAACRREHVAPVMYVDGYYGGSLAGYDDYATLLLVGGGIGVTPLLAILEDVAASVVSSGGRWTQRVEFVFAFREASLFRIVAPLVARLRDLDPQRQYFRARLFATSGFSNKAMARRLEPKILVDLAASYRPGADRETTTSARRNLPTARPFYEPLRASLTLRVTLFLVSYTVTGVMLAAVRWGNGWIQGNDRFELWPLERAFELAVFSSVGALVPFGFLWFERSRFVSGQALPATQKLDESVMVTPTPTPLAPFVGGASAVLGADLHTVGDLLRFLDVAMGERPDMNAVLSEVLDSHLAASTVNHLLPTAGVFVSGPNALKTVTNAGVAALGSQHFDVHEEEFEL